MATAGAVARRYPLEDRIDASVARERFGVAHVSRTGIVALVLVAPFEALRPLVRVPGQSFTTVETVLLLVLTASACAIVRRGVAPALPWRRALPWIAVVAVAAMSAVAAPADRTNALHMAARFALAAGIWVTTVNAGASQQARRTLVIAIVVSGTIVALLVVVDFVWGARASLLLAPFRTSVAVVGSQIRASGPFQYPTIASMFLEITFAAGLGLLVSDDTTSRARVLTVVVLASMAEAIVLTFTRAGLITIALSTTCVGAVEWRRRGVDRSVLAIVALGAIVALELVSSRSLEVWQLRLTTEGQGNWYSALIDAPERLTLDTRATIDVPITIVNTGRATWDSSATPPIRLSYHWVASDSDEVVAWNGLRTLFAEPVRGGERVTIAAHVDGPGRPGLYRLMWDVEEEHRLWFSTEPNAVIAFTNVDVTGPVVSNAPRSGPQRIPAMAVRPGRLQLWGAAWRMFVARPLLGVGPDNYRLLYGRFSTIAHADPRVHSNDMYLEVLAGMGIAGVLACGWLAFTALRSAIVAARSPLGLGIAAACAAIAVHGLVDAFLAFTGTYVLIAVTLGLATACEQDDTGHAHRV
jgi:hypothetical protein